MNLIAQLKLEGEIPEAGIFTVGAFHGDECRGIGQMVDGRLFITVHGGQPDETITFRALENASQEEYLIEETFLFANELKGNLQQPVELHIPALSVKEIAISPFIIYPNPVRDKLFLSGIDFSGIKSIKILAVSGNVILATDNYIQRQGINVSSLAEGNYIVAVATETGMFYRKFIKLSRK
jgi:hypothetical protein